MEQLIIRIAWDDRLTWVHQIAGRIHAQSPHPMSAEPLRDTLPVLSAKARIIVLVPGRAVVLAQVALTKHQRKHRDETIPFLIEEKLAEDIASMHVVCADDRRRESDAIAVAAVPHRRMEHWVALLGAASLTPDVMLPDMLALTHQPGQWQLLCDGTSAWLRSTADYGVAMDAALMPAWLSLTFAQSDSLPNQLQLSGAVDQAWFDDIAGIAAIYPQVTLTVQPVDTNVDTVMARGMAEASMMPAMNLLLGHYARHRRHAGSGMNRLTSWIKIAAGLLMFYALLAGVQTLYYTHQAREANAEMVTLYREIFPGDKKIISPIRQMKSQLSLGSVGSRDGAMTLLGALAAVWDPAAAIRVETFDYREAESSLRLRLSAPALAAINELGERLRAAGLNAQVLGVTNNAQGVMVEMVVARGQP